MPCDFHRRISVFCPLFSAFGGPGGDLLSRVLRQSTIGAEAFDGRVRDGIGSCRLAEATRPAKGGEAKLGSGAHERALQA